MYISYHISPFANKALESWWETVRELCLVSYFLVTTLGLVTTEIRPCVVAIGELELIDYQGIQGIIYKTTSLPC